MLGIIRYREGEQNLVEPEHVALAGGWAQHKRIAERLDALGIGTTPLMLVPVED